MLDSTRDRVIAIAVIALVVVFGISVSSRIVVVPRVLVVGGSLSYDTTWSGTIHVASPVSVPSGVTLTILPGTVVEFEHYRGYKEQKTTNLEVDGGTIEAVGSADEPIWFTSDADSPLNGDWGGITILNSNSSVFEYVIVEFAIIGIEQFYSSTNVSHSIVRWCNTEGLYAEHSSPVFEYNLIYSNAYHDIALEQYNKDVLVRNNIFKGGHFSVHAEATDVTIDRNYFTGYSSMAVTGGQFSNMTITNNSFESIAGEAVSFDFTVNGEVHGNIVGNGTISIPDIGIEDVGAGRLGYVPGDPVDQYMYVYDTVDETRRIVERLDSVTDFGWSLTYADGFLWRFNHRSITLGLQQDFVKIDPETQAKTFYGNDVMVNPRALCYDGAYFWAYDFTLHTLYKFSVNSTSIVIAETYGIPGMTSLASDGSFLYTANTTAGGISKYDLSGNFIETILLSEGRVLALAWTGTYFWGDSYSHITKFLPNGTVVGKIYPIALETTDITWDGTYLWTLQKTCELWNDGKVFKVQIIDDQFLMLPGG